MNDHMKEAERLAEELRRHSRKLGTPCGDTMHVMCAAADAMDALLAHIQRGAVPERDNGKRVLREVFALCEDTETKCSDETGDFALGRRFEAKGIARAIGAWYQEEFCGRTHMGEPAAPAPDRFRDAAEEVPMPDPVARMLEWRGRLALRPQPSARTFEEFPQSETFPANKDAYWSDGKLLVLADEARTYGAACRVAGEAAGYARGMKEAGRDAERYRWLCDVATEQQWVELGGYTVKRIIDGAIDAALRGEVKP